MKIRRKVTHCLNCNALLDKVYNYCPMCGQENNDNNVSVGTLIHDFFSNYFAFDSKLVRTVVPFFIKPGFITNRYFEGKRVSYAHPLRMYLIISLFYFFIWSLIATDLVKGVEDDSPLINTPQTSGLEGINLLDSAGRARVRTMISEESLSKLDSELVASDTTSFLQALRRNTTPEEKEAIKALLSSNIDSLFDASFPEPPDEEPVGEDSVVTEEEFILFDLDYETINELSKDLTLSDQEILDSLKLGELSNTEDHLVRQVIRISRAEKEAVVSYIVKNLPVMMLFLIPLFALILKLLYVRRSYLYINHIIHALHLHSFAYLFYGFSLILSYFILESDGWKDFVNITSFILVTTYCYLSFFRVYRQGWFKTLVKFNMTGFIYISLIVAFLIIEMLISFLLY